MKRKLICILSVVLFTGGIVGCEVKTKTTDEVKEIKYRDRYKQRHSRGNRNRGNERSGK